MRDLYIHLCLTLIWCEKLSIGCEGGLNGVGKVNRDRKSCLVETWALAYGMWFGIGGHGSSL